MYFELYNDISRKDSDDEPESILSNSQQRTPSGILMQILDPDMKEVETVLMASTRRNPLDEQLKGGLHQHRSYHRQAQKAGMYRICLRPHKDLFKDNAAMKYEMSI